MQKITPCLWFDGKAEEAMCFYTSIFKNSKVGNVTRYGEAGPGENGSVMTATFEIEGQEFEGPAAGDLERRRASRLSAPEARAVRPPAAHRAVGR